jgi:hypothetical protein
MTTSSTSRRGHAGIAHHPPAGQDCPSNQRIDQLIQLGTTEHPAPLIARGQIQQQLDLVALRQGLLRLARNFQRTAQQGTVAATCKTGLIQQPLGYRPVEVVTAQCRVAPRRHDLKHPSMQAQYRDIESAATKVIHRVYTVSAAIQAIGHGGRSGFVEQPIDMQTGEAGGVFGGLALGIVKVRRHGNHDAR